MDIMSQQGICDRRFRIMYEHWNDILPRIPRALVLLSVSARQITELYKE